MKKLLLSAAVLAISAGAALAADLPSRKGPPVLPPPPPPPLWTGFYAGLNAGYGFGTNSNTQSIGLGSLDFTGYGHDRYQKVELSQAAILDLDRNKGWGGNSTLGAGLALSGVGGANQSGFIGGGQVGYNYQWGPSFVIGLEADIQGTGIRGSSYTAGLGSDSAVVGYDRYHKFVGDSTAWGGTRVNAGVDWLGTVRGRVGYLFTPTLLAYVTGGLTYGGVYANVNNYGVSTTTISSYHHQDYKDLDQVESQFSHTFIGGGNKSQTLVGWNVGGGLEWLVAPNWSVKAEAIYWNMGNQTLPTVALATAPESSLGRGGLERSLDVQRGSGPSASPAVVYGATRVNYQGVIARAGINYHFNWFAPAPVVAKY
jgi:outer membrane immunogenic protein